MEVRPPHRGHPDNPKPNDGAYSVGERPRAEDIPAFKTWAPQGPTRAPGMVNPGTIDLTKRPAVHFPDGSAGSLYTYNTPIESGKDKGKWIVTPGITPDGKVLTEDQAYDRAMRTGQHLGIFDSEKNSESYATFLHMKQGGFQAYKNGGDYKPNGEYWVNQNPKDIENGAKYSVSIQPPK